MKTKIVRIGILALALMSGLLSFPPSAEAAVCGANTNMYRSAATGNWAVNGTWEVSTDGGVNWGAAGCWPSNVNGTIQIRNGHTVTVTAAITVDQVTIDAGGQVTVNSGQTWTINDGSGTDLTVNGTVQNAGTVGDTGNSQLAFNSGSVYRHALNGGAIPSTAAFGTVTWNSASTVEITGTTTTVPSGLTQSFGNFTWNNTGQTADISFAGNLSTVNGNLTVASTGGGASELRLVNDPAGNDLSTTIGGNLNVQGGNLDLCNSNDSGSMTVNIGGSFNQTGGTVTSGNATTPSVINFTGASGQFTQSAGTFTTTNINFNVNNGATLTLNNNLTVASGRTFTVIAGGTLNTGTNVISGAGTFAVSGTGPGGTLGIGSSAGITSSGATGNIQTTTRTFNTGANYTYNGSVAQVTGNGLPATVRNLAVNNAAGVTLTNGATISGILTLTSGDLKTGANTLTLGSSATTVSTGNDVVGNVLRSSPAVGSALSYGSQFTTIQFNTAGPTSMTVNLTKGTAPFQGAVLRQYTLTPVGSFTSANIQFHLDATTELNGNAVASLNLYRFSGTTWLMQGATLRTSAGSSSRVSLNGVTTMSPWGLASINSPTAVTLSRFNARFTDDKVALNWATGSEVNTAGFNIYRSEERAGPYVRINGQLIPASPNAIGGDKYQYQDATAEPGKTYYYQLEDIEYDGTSTRHTPVVVSAPAASAVNNNALIALGAGLSAFVVIGGALFAMLKKLNLRNTGTGEQDDV